MKLRSQLNDAFKNFDKAKNENLKLSKIISINLKKAPRRPKKSLEELNNRIGELEFKRSTYSLSLNEVWKLIYFNYF